MRTATQAATAIPPDRGDFAALIRQHQAMVFSVGWNFLRDRATAEELAQEVFLQLYQSLPDLQSPEHVTFWLRRTAVHRAIDMMRKRKLRPQLGLEDAPEPSVPPETGDPLLKRMLGKLVASLPEKPRAVVILRYQEDMDPADIADTLGMPVRTVKSHLSRSLAMLREKLGRSTNRAAARLGAELPGADGEEHI
ncbi:MAG TPA: sigma-70 family RNA polymerase sigma factor [Bryobacteraceae bacterium]|nr:sigma-70 family RNA polymerase sigma factor [Bryobacteraceae bacterium]